MKFVFTSIALTLLGAGASLQNFESFSIGATTVGYTADGIAVNVVNTHVADVNGPASWKDRSLSTRDPTCPCSPATPMTVTFTPPISLMSVSMTTSAGFENVLPSVACKSTDGNDWYFGLRASTTGSWPHTRGYVGSAGSVIEPGDTGGPKITECTFENGDFDQLYTTP